MFLLSNRWVKKTISALTMFLLVFFISTVFCPAAAELDDCTEERISAQKPAGVSSHGCFLRSSPVVQANLLFNGYSETAALSQDEKMLQGHVTAVRLFDPVDPGHTEKVELWDAGEALNKMDPGDRNIYFPTTAVTRMAEITIATGNGGTRTFSGTLFHPIVASTVRITDQRETFRDVHIKDLRGDSGGKGTINRFSGVFEVNFDEPPGEGVPINCSYVYYSTEAVLLAFNNENVGNDCLALDDTKVSDGYLYDLDGNGRFDESDGDYLVQWVRGYSDESGAKKKWLLGAVDHSTPAVATPPGRPHWYYGSAITEDERREFDSFLVTNKQRRTVVYAGARDGMLHAFDGGQFRWGDNAETSVVEKQGYFEWVEVSSDFSFNEQWNDLLVRCSVSPPDFRWQNTGDGDKAPNYGSGKELWAFIPPNLLARLKNNLMKAEDQAGVDASPFISDVYINGQWRTVLLAGEGNGGDAIFCLDITDPDKPIFLWEFADPDLFRSMSSPAVVRIGRIALGGIKKWVAFFVSGDGADVAQDPSVYIIDVADGSLLKRVVLYAGIDRNGDGIDDNRGGVPCGEPAIIDSDGNGYVDRMYIGTDKGFMFKLNIPDDPMMPIYEVDSCVINRDFSYEDDTGFLHTVPVDQQFHPIYASPTVIVDNSYKKGGAIEYHVRIFFGTCDNPYLDEKTNMGDTTYHFFSYIDHNEKGACNTGSVELDWFRALPQGHRIFASAFAAAGTVYFGTSTSETADPGAENGAGRMYALNIADNKVIHEKEVGNILSPPLVEDEHLYVKTNASGDGKNIVIMGGGGYNNDVVRCPTAPAGIRAWKELW